MAKRNSKPSPIVERQFTHVDLEMGIKKLQKRIGEVQQLQADKIKYNDQRVENMEAAIQDAVCEIFGENSSEYKRYQYHRIYSGPSYMGISEDDLQLGYIEGIPQTIVMLEGLIDKLQEKLEDLSIRQTSVCTKIESALPELTNDIFIVHGRDDLAKVSVVNVIQKIGLNPIVLGELAHQGRTIIEKFEQSSHKVQFAIVLLTPDDTGALKCEENNLKLRARQNVLLELGYFVGRLGRERVCALNAGVEELPSDYNGVGYIDMDDRGAWKSDLGKELQAAGYQFDFAKLF